MDLEREWVEAVAETEGGRIELVPVDTLLPPSRAPRRRLDLRAGRHGAGQGVGRAAGPADAMMSGPVGAWRQDGDILDLEIPGWAGRYRIEALADERLILNRL